VIESEIPNEPPVADVQSVVTAEEETLVILDGSGSTDFDGVIISYLWEQVDGDYLSLSKAAASAASFMAPAVLGGGKSFKFSLTITDDGDPQEADTDTVIVNVIDTDSGNTDPNEPPFAVALPDTGDDIVNENETLIKLTGSGSTDPEDNIVSYSWEKVSHPGILLSGAQTMESTFTAPADVTEDTELIFRLTVTDVGGLRDTAETVVTVLWENEPPTAKAGYDQTVSEGQTVLLDGSESSDPDNGIDTYSWEQLSGTTVELLNADTETAIFLTPDIDEDELLAFLLTVTDNSGYVKQDIVHVSVESYDTGPVADAGNDQVAGFEELVDLDGSGTTDTDGTIVSYLWEQLYEETVSLNDSTTSTPYFQTPSADMLDDSEDYLAFTFSLTVKDDEDQESTDTVIVNVTDNPSAVLPLADAGEDLTASEDSTIILDGSKSIDTGRNSEMVVSNNIFSFQIIDEEPDDDAAPGNIAAVSSGPQANCDLTFESNNLENIDGRFSLFLYSWEDSASGLTVDLSNNWWGMSGASVIETLIYDSAFDSLLPEVVFEPFETNEVPNSGCTDLSYPPIAKACDDQSADPDDTVTLDCPDLYDPDQILSFQWTQTSGITVELIDADTSEATFIVPAIPDQDEEDELDDEINVLNFQLTVSDPYGFYDSDEVTVTINEITENEKKVRSGDSGCFISVTLW